MSVKVTDGVCCFSYCVFFNSTLSSCIHAVVALLYPFSWQHTFIPVLPGSMLDIVCCPTPFLVGLLSSSLPKLKELPVEEVSTPSLRLLCVFLQILHFGLIYPSFFIWMSLIRPVFFGISLFLCSQLSLTEASWNSEYLCLADKLQKYRFRVIPL